MIAELHTEIQTFITDCIGEDPNCRVFFEAAPEDVVCAGDLHIVYERVSTDTDFDNCRNIRQRSSTWQFTISYEPAENSTSAMLTAYQQIDAWRDCLRLWLLDQSRIGNSPVHRIRHLGIDADGRDWGGLARGNTHRRWASFRLQIFH